MNPARIATVAVTLGLTAVLGAGCSSDDEPTVGAGGDAAATTAAAEHNDADVTFAQMMIPHHEQAVEMAQLAADRADDQRVKDLAERIEAAQAPEIEQMQAWLESWGAEASGGGEHEGMDGGTMSEEEMGGGTMSEEDMQALEEASGAEFDVLFLQMMIEHHAGAVAMADTEIAEGQFPDAVDLARTIKSTQEAEIAEMEQLLAELGG